MHQSDLFIVTSFTPISRQFSFKKNTLCVAQRGFVWELAENYWSLWCQVIIWNCYPFLSRSEHTHFNIMFTADLPSPAPSPNMKMRYFPIFDFKHLQDSDHVARCLHVHCWINKKQTVLSFKAYYLLNRFIDLVSYLRLGVGVIGSCFCVLLSVICFPFSMSFVEMSVNPWLLSHFVRLDSHFLFVVVILFITHSVKSIHFLAARNLFVTTSSL